MWIFPGLIVLEAPNRRSSVENFYWLVARITFRGLKPVIPAFDHAHVVDIPSGEADLNTHSHTHTHGTIDIAFGLMHTHTCSHTTGFIVVVYGIIVCVYVLCEIHGRRF